MTDQSPPGASALMDSGTSEPMAPSRAQAFSRLEEMRTSHAFQEALARGDTAAHQEVKSVRAVADSPMGVLASHVPGSAPQERQQVLDSLLQHADIPAAVQQQFLERTPVSLDEVRMATAERKRMMSDRRFVEAYLQGGRAERTRMTLVNLILTSPTK